MDEIEAAPLAEPSIRVLLAIEQEVVRRGYETMIATVRDVHIDVVSEVSGVEGVLAAVASARPDVVIISSSIAQPGAMEIIRQVTGRGSVAVIMTAAHDYYDSELAQAIQLGASAFLPQNFSAQELVEAILAAQAGHAFLPPSAVRRLFDNFLILPTPQAGSVPEQLRCLSTREVEIVRGIGLGKTNREIARWLSVSEATVKTHVTKTLRKLVARDRMHLAQIAWRLGLVPVLPPQTAV